MLKDKEYAQTPYDMVLCRAKRKDTGEWIEGCAVVVPSGNFLPGCAFIIPCVFAGKYEQGVLFLGGFIEVLPETICRFTGLYDVNKTKIFEKDIVKNHMGFRQVVQYMEGRFVFRSDLDYIYHEWHGETFCACSKRMADCTDGITCDTVVGNIFDDAEFLAYASEATDD